MSKVRRWKEGKGLQTNKVRLVMSKCRLFAASWQSAIDVSGTDCRSSHRHEPSLRELVPTVLATKACGKVKQRKRTGVAVHLASLSVCLGFYVRSD